MSTQAQVSTPTAREIRIERTFNAPRSRVWRAMTDPALLAQWWCRGNPLVIERFEFEKGGHWRFVEHGPDGVHGFEGRFRRIEPEAVIEQTFEWDGMPGHVSVERMTLEDLGDGRTRMVTVALFTTEEDRDGMLHSGMEGGMNQSYAALDGVLAAALDEAAATPARITGASVRPLAPMPCLMFPKGGAEAAAAQYVEMYQSIGQPAALGAMTHYTETGRDTHGQAAGAVLSVRFNLAGMEFLAFNGGPPAAFSDATSMMVLCDTQAELDHFFDRLVDGGKPQMCGWVNDRFGVCWQVAPRRLMEMICDPDPAAVQRATAAFMEMRRFDLAALERAFAGEG